MVKVKNTKMLKWCLEKHVADKVTVKWVANHLKITPRKFKQIYAKYRATDTAPTIEQTLDRPKKQTTKETVKIIKQTYKKDRIDAAYLKKITYARQKTSISHRTIHGVSLTLGYARYKHSKPKRRTPWIMYERKHSLSLVHMD
ncbi:MAG: hypothetical protein LBC12_01770 [Nitrososphaerota archaeon]|jgi:hypothetical protein|nr:hypothetical protein [Nitrososphaerota archaeon]